MRVHSLFISEKFLNRKVMLIRAGDSSSYVSSNDCGDFAAVGEEVEGSSAAGPASAWLVPRVRSCAPVTKALCTAAVDLTHKASLATFKNAELEPGKATSTLVD